MDNRYPLQTSDGNTRPSSPLRNTLSGAFRFWEPRRILYNFVLTGIALIWIVWTWPHFQEALTLQHLLILFVLATSANICYCAAYLAEIPMQQAIPQSALRRWRWALWIAGMALAVLITNYWIADEIYPYVN
jgi:hypothetical protein